MHLVSIGDAQENEWLSSKAESLSTEIWWMGLNDLAQEGRWIWENNDPVTYTNWAPNEPNSAGEEEDCGVLLRYYPQHTWNDEPCRKTLFFVCEKPGGR
jgi:hypothetical protein